MNESILAVLLSFAISTRDQLPETLEQRVERLRVVATAIEVASGIATCSGAKPGCRPILGDQALAAAVLIVQARRESGLRRDVQVGQCRAHECDRGRAMGLWQLHRVPGQAIEDWRWWGSLEEDALTSSAERTIRLWAGASRGGTKPECGFARLAGWAVCWSNYGHDRAAETLRIAARLRK